VVANIRALGGQVTACGITGQDQPGRCLLQEITASGASTAGIISSRTALTISKTRVIARSLHFNQQLVRLDREQDEAYDAQIYSRLCSFVEKHAKEFAVVVISDYGKGAVDSALLTRLAELREQQRFLYLIDPKRRNFSHYRGASLIKPNVEEAGLAAGLEIGNEQELFRAGTSLLEFWQTEAVLISRGEEGMTLFKQGAKAQNFPTTAREVFDVTGAGDTVLATCALALGAGAPLEDATVLANHAAGIVVGKVGTATVNQAELLLALGQKRAKLP
jgi:D-beta-D-heptose 7-phosphate kinase/D-beta-D-heptose 1-phosphate adenosyltransferase